MFDHRTDSGILHALPPVPAKWQTYFSDCAVEMTLHVGSRLIWLFRTPGKIHAFMDIADARPKHKGWHLHRREITFRDGSHAILSEFGSFHDRFMDADDFRVQTVNRHAAARFCLAKHQRVSRPVARRGRNIAADEQSRENRGQGF